MTVLQNNTSLIKPITENLQSLRLAEQTQPSPNGVSPTGSLSNRGGFTGSGKHPSQSGKWVLEIREPPTTEMVTATNAAALMKPRMSEGESTVVSHRQRDDDHSVFHSFNTEYFDEEELFRMHYLLVDMAGGMMLSPPRINSSPPSDDFPGNFVPISLWDYDECIEVEELQNRDEMMWPTWKQQCLEVDTASENNHALGISLALELESREGIMERNSVSYRQRNEDHSVKTIYPPCAILLRSIWTRIKHYHPNVRPALASFESLCNLEMLCLEVTLVKRGKGIRPTCKLKHLEVDTASEKNHTLGILLALEPESRGGMMQQNSSCERQIPESGGTNEERNIVGLKRIDAKGNSSKEKDTICRWQKDYGITRELLEQLFDKKSRDDAAKTFGVSISTFKRACRDLGITRWPNRKRKRANCSLNQKDAVQAVKRHKGSQPCPALPPEEGTSTIKGDSAMSVKVTYKNDTIRFPLSSSSTMKYLEEQLERRLKISLDNFFIKYQDEEDEWDFTNM